MNVAPADQDGHLRRYLVSVPEVPSNSTVDTPMLPEVDALVSVLIRTVPSLNGLWYPEK